MAPQADKRTVRFPSHSGHSASPTFSRSRPYSVALIADIRPEAHAVNKHALDWQNRIRGASGQTPVASGVSSIVGAAGSGVGITTGAGWGWPGWPMSAVFSITSSAWRATT